MIPLVKGALVEYNPDDPQGSLSNIVVFQLNPESLSRSIQIPSQLSEQGTEEFDQFGSLPMEKISFEAYFNAELLLTSANIPEAERESNSIAQMLKKYGIGFQLASLEKMAYPLEMINQALGKISTGNTDAVGSELPTSTSKGERLKRPRILFIWGERLLPIIIESLTITEKKFDRSLKPIEATARIDLSVLNLESIKRDKTALGALQNSTRRKLEQVKENQKNIPVKLSKSIKSRIVEVTESF
ncbi:MAG: hypothetical protein ACFFBD_10290 [Candidatus Hodarchaeota archaeon]